jgi:hypothetical protein
VKVVGGGVAVVVGGGGGGAVVVGGGGGAVVVGGGAVVVGCVVAFRVVDFVEILIVGNVCPGVPPFEESGFVTS